MSAGYTKPESEDMERLSLKDAAEVLKISESGVRARFKKGQIEGERDNSGKIWVFVSGAMKDAVQVALRHENEGDSGAFRELIETLHGQVIGLEMERDRLRQEAGEAGQLREKLARIEAETEAARAQVADLRAQLATSESERRQLFSAVVERAAQPREEETNHHGGFSFLGFQITRKAVR